VPNALGSTGSQEQLVLRDHMWPVRVYRELHSRTKHREAPRCYPVTLIRGGEESVIELPPEEYPILLHFPLFPPPAMLTGRRSQRGIETLGLTTCSYGPRPDEVAKKYGATEIKITQKFQPVAFARVIAKIAYAWAVAERGLEGVDGVPFPVPAILGRTDDIGNWVGMISDPVKKVNNVLHRIGLHEDQRGLLIGEVQLFSDSWAPAYGVILGRLSEKGY